MINFAQNIFQMFAAVDPACTRNFLGLPAWYKYLDVQRDQRIEGEVVKLYCTPQLTGLNDIWLIGLALIEILLRLAVLIAIAYVVWAGIRYSESRGNVDKASNAKNTLIDAITGLVIALVAVAVISFIGSRFTQ